MGFHASEGYETGSKNPLDRIRDNYISFAPQYDTLPGPEATSQPEESTGISLLQMLRNRVHQPSAWFLAGECVVRIRKKAKLDLSPLFQFCRLSSRIMFQDHVPRIRIGKEHRQMAAMSDNPVQISSEVLFHGMTGESPANLFLLWRIL